MRNPRQDILGCIEFTGRSCGSKTFPCNTSSSWITGGLTRGIAVDASKMSLAPPRRAGWVRCARALIALSTYPFLPPLLPLSLALSLSWLNGAGNSFCTRHLEEASTTLSQPPEHFHERGAIIRAGQPRLFNISQNAESLPVVNPRDRRQIWCSSSRE